MKIAFLHPDLSSLKQMMEQLRAALTPHELLSWVAGSAAPAPDLEIIIAMGKVTRELLAGQPKLQFIQTATAGHEGVDLDAATGMGIWVAFAPSGDTGNAISVAEFAVLLLLGALRRLNLILAAARDPANRPPDVLPALHGKSVCIVGFGSIGRLVAERLRPFGMRLLATDLHRENIPPDVTVFPPDQLTEAVKDADCVVICAPASKENENLFDEDVFAKMKKGAVVVNVARGSLVDESALAAAIGSGQIAAAGLDVLRTEPADPHNPLFGLPQVLITPHVAGQTDLMFEGTTRYIRHALEEFAAGRKPGGLLNEPPKPRRDLRA